ncbi:MAG: hypothetical protein M5U26_00685 [Planctomycetota bacterium]|nr:hypothetical protein [Planctomycetota bacterium]
MPLSYRIDPRRRVVHERATGVVTAADMKETLNRRLHDPQYHADMPVLSDYLEGTFRAATPELLLVADILLGRKSRLAGARWAFFHAGQPELRAVADAPGLYRGLGDSTDGLS